MQDQQDNRRARPSTILDKVIASVFLAVFIVAGVSFGNMSRSMGAPTHFSWVGGGFALIAFLMLVRVWVGTPRQAMQNSQIEEPPAPTRPHGACPGCGSRLVDSSGRCGHCGGRLPGD